MRPGPRLNQLDVLASMIINRPMRKECRDTSSKSEVYGFQRTWYRQSLRPAVPPLMKRPIFFSLSQSTGRDRQF